MSTPSDPSQIPTDPVQRNEWIKYQLRVRGTSMSKLARQLGVTRQAVRNALATPYPRMERVIAAEIGVCPSAIWPERYRGAVAAEDDDGYGLYLYADGTSSPGDG
jgi:lambda repressor-like predicted transcriptional regulator